MPFPQSPLDVRVELNLSGTAWTNVTSQTYQRNGTPPPITIQRGRTNESSTASAASCSMQWNNRNGQFSPKNATGPYYGQLGRNTPVRLSVPDQQTYLRLETDSTSYASTPDAAALQIAGNFDVRMDIQLSNYHASVLAGKWQGTLLSWLLQTNDDGTLTLFYFDGSNSHTVTSNQPIPVGRTGIRVAFSPNSTGFTAFYTGPPMNGGAGTWTQLGSQIATAPVTISTAVGQPVTVGNTPATGGCQGRIYEFQLYNGTPSLVANPHFYAQTDGTTSFTDAQSNVWSVNGTAEISGRSYRGHFEASSLPQSWDPSGIDVWVPVQASGLLRRLQAASNPVASAMKRAILGFSGEFAPAAYWTCEDMAGATQLAPAVSAGSAMTFTSSSGQALAADTTFACSSALPTIGSSTFLGHVGTVASGFKWTDNVFRFLWHSAAGAIPNNGVIATMFTAGTVARIHLTYGTGGGLQVQGYNSSGTQLFSSGVFAFGLDNQISRISIDLQNNGTNSVLWKLETYFLNAPSAQAISGSVTGTIGAVTRVSVNPGAANFNGATFGHASVQGKWDTLFDVENNFAVDGSLTGPLRAWAGESAGHRFQRLCTENNINYRIYGWLANSAAMGAQQIDTLENILQTCEDTDRGMQYEPRQILGLGYRTLASITGQSNNPVVAADYSQAHLGDGSTTLGITDDDQFTVNDWTVTNNNGSSYQLTLNDGTGMSVSNPPVGVGDYASTLTAYLYQDTQLPSLAGWMLHVSTCDEFRYPAVPFSLARTAVINSVFYNLLNAELGDLVTIANPPTYLTFDIIRQLVAGQTEALGGFHYNLAWQCIPASPYDVVILNDTTYGRLDTASSSLTVPAPTSGGFTVTTGVPPAWTTAGGDMPFNVTVGGEVCTVTAVATSSRKQCKVGAFLNPAAMGHTTFAQASTAWNTLTGVTVDVTRVYLANSYPITADMTAMITAGTRMLISIQPDFNPPSATTLATITSWLQSLQVAGADAVIAMWSEPYYSSVNSGGPNQAQYKAVYQYYGPTIRQYFPLAVVFSTGSIYFNDESSFYPGDALCDQFAVDYYTTSPFIGSTLDAAAAIAPTRPFGIWEFNGATDPVNGQTQGQITTHFQYIQSFMQQRETLGQPCADICLFNGAPQSSWLGDGTTTNAGFEGGLGNWTAAGSSTIALVTTQAHSGADSMGVTSTAAGSVQAASCTAANIATQGMPVTPGQIVYGAAWAKAATTGRSFEVGIGFYTSGGVAVSNLYGSTTPDVTTGWTQATTGAASITVPATAAFARLLVQFLSEAAAGEVHWVDDCEMRIVPATNDLTNTIEFAWDFRVALWQAIHTALDGTSASQTFTVTRSVNGVVKTHSAGTPIALTATPILALA